MSSFKTGSILASQAEPFVVSVVEAEGWLQRKANRCSGAGGSTGEQPFSIVLHWRGTGW